MRRSDNGAAGRRRCQRALTPGRVAGGRAPRVEAARPADLAALVELDRACFGRRAWPPAGWVEAVTDPGWTTLVVRDGADPIAAAVLLPFLPVAHLASIGVHPDRRNLGIGTSLLHDVLERARAAGARFLALEVDLVNGGARALYRREGFGIVRRFKEDGRWRIEMHRRVRRDDGA
jgi:[ribosomal protein S18]-alanine N-acetyltransferase